MIDCEAQAASLHDVRCYNETEVLPLTHEEIWELWVERKGMWRDHIMQRRTGWYLQQLLKLQAAHFLPGLGEYYVVWDSDMVPIQPLDFIRNGKVVVRRSDNPGGDYARDHYVDSTIALFNWGDDARYTTTKCPDCVSHHMVVKKADMLEMLLEIADGDESLRGRDLAVYLLKKLPQKITRKIRWLHHHVARDIFSEYTLNAEWLLYKHPEDCVYEKTIHVRRLYFDRKGKYGDIDRCDAVSLIHEHMHRIPCSVKFIGIENTQRMADHKNTGKFFHELLHAE
mmetsp:Transcript_1783/g.5063  ORF Transcript_1783/g.5063 Transcript_1783/m.5063 type:complete len:283 (-) Transcript_1783:133-981(-)